MDRKAQTLMLGFALCLPQTALARSPLCPNNEYITSPMVPNKTVAADIYKSVGQAMLPNNFKKYPIVIVDDNGDRWHVFQTKADPSPLMVGGGQLVMDINKCTGEISHAALAK